MTVTTSAIEKYLRTEQAERDVAVVMIDGSGWNLGPRSVAWSIGEEGAWRYLWIAHRNDTTPKVYFRPGGDHFFVEDPGEGLRALRLRTGYRDMGTYLRYEAVPDILMLSDGRLTGVHEGDNYIPAKELPRIIVAVLLASYRVANLEPSKEGA